MPTFTYNWVSSGNQKPVAEVIYCEEFPISLQTLFTLSSKVTKPLRLKYECLISWVWDFFGYLFSLLRTSDNCHQY